MNRPRNFKNRGGNPKMTSSSVAGKSVVLGLIARWDFKDSKVFSLIISAFTEG